jgi:hypothetical protein
MQSSQLSFYLFLLFLFVGWLDCSTEWEDEDGYREYGTGRAYWWLSGMCFCSFCIFDMAERTQCRGG